MICIYIIWPFHCFSATKSWHSPWFCSSTPSSLIVFLFSSARKTSQTNQTSQTVKKRELPKHIYKIPPKTSWDFYLEFPNSSRLSTHSRCEALATPFQGLQHGSSIGSGGVSGNPYVWTSQRVSKWLVNRLFHLPPWKLTYPLKNDGWKMHFLLK